MIAMSASKEVQDFLNRDPREMPRYSVAEAARYLDIAEQTLRAWFYGTTYGSGANIKPFPLILTPASSELLSFYDIASAHTLVALKREGLLPNQKIRIVVESLKNEFSESRYPLLGHTYYRFGRDLIVKRLGDIVNLTRSRQLGIKRIVDKAWSRLELDSENMPLRFSPLRSTDRRGKGAIIIDPNLSSGRPVIRGTGIAAEIIAKRKWSGESKISLAKDYHVSKRAIEAAISYFGEQRAA